MSRRLTLTIICDNCGLMHEHEVLNATYDLAIYTSKPYDVDWKQEAVIGTNIPRDYCPQCRPQKPAKLSQKQT